MSLVKDNLLINLLKSYDNFVKNCNDSCECEKCSLSFNNKYECFVYHLLKGHIEEVE